MLSIVSAVNFSPYIFVFVYKNNLARVLLVFEEILIKFLFFMECKVYININVYIHLYSYEYNIGI